MPAQQTYNDDSYFLGQGNIFLATRQFNGPQNGGFINVGDCETLQITNNQKFEDIEESQSGLREVAAHIPNGVSHAVKIMLKKHTLQNIANALWGTKTANVAAGSVTAEAVTLYNGAMTPLANPSISKTTAPVVKTTGGTPVTLVEGTDYTVNYAMGSITVLASSTVVAAGAGVACTVDYSYLAYTGKVEAMTNGQAEFALRYEGVNTANGMAPVIANIRRVSLDMIKTLDLLNTKSNTIELDGMLLPDQSIAIGSGTSRYYNVVKG